MVPRRALGSSATPGKYVGLFMSRYFTDCTKQIHADFPNVPDFRAF